jgi:hypothetical protein
MSPVDNAPPFVVPSADELQKPPYNLGPRISQQVDTELKDLASKLNERLHSGQPIDRAAFDQICQSYRGETPTAFMTANPGFEDELKTEGSIDQNKAAQLHHESKSSAQRSGTELASEDRSDSLDSGQKAERRPGDTAPDPDKKSDTQFGRMTEGSTLPDKDDSEGRSKPGDYRDTSLRDTTGGGEIDQEQRVQSYESTQRSGTADQEYRTAALDKGTAREPRPHTIDATDRSVVGSKAGTADVLTDEELKDAKEKGISEEDALAQKQERMLPEHVRALRKMEREGTLGSDSGLGYAPGTHDVRAGDHVREQSANSAIRGAYDPYEGPGERKTGSGATEGYDMGSVFESLRQLAERNHYAMVINERTEDTLNGELQLHPGRYIEFEIGPGGVHQYYTYKSGNHVYVDRQEIYNGDKFSMEEFSQSIGRSTRAA